MGFAASNKTISYSIIDASSLALIQSGLHSIFLAVGWTASVISGGYQYLLTDPNAEPLDALQAKVRIYDDGTGFVRIQFVNLDEDKLGAAHHLRPLPAQVIQVWANCCQFFISVPGSAGLLTTVSGGIPFIGGTSSPARADCIPDLPGASATEVWWSTGSDDIFNIYNLRSLINPSSWSAFYNGTLCGAGTIPEGVLRLFPRALANNWPATFGPTPHTRFFGGLPMDHEVFIGWGLPGGYTRMMGQLYDCFMRSEYTPIDTEIVFQGFNFINFQGDPPFPVSSDLSRYSSIFLLKDVATSSSDYAYIY